MKKIIDFEIVDHGLEHSQYFQGCGTSGTDYDECCTGIGYSQKEALESAIDNLLEYEYEIPRDLEKRLKVASEIDAVSLAYKNDNPDVFKLDFHCYNGMTIPLGSHESMKDAQYSARDWLNDREEKQSATITCLEENDSNIPVKWEVETESNSKGFAVTDYDGILKIESIINELPEENEVYYHVSIRIKTQG